MLSFEVLLAVRVSGSHDVSNDKLFPSDISPGPASRARVLGLLSQVALLLEQVGTTPPHRLGTAAVYGRHLQVYLRRRIVTLCVDHERQETAQHGDAMHHSSMVSGSYLLPPRHAESTLDQLFAANRISPTDHAQSAMALNWDGES